jgi:hypothetical protein
MDFPSVTIGAALSMTAGLAFAGDTAASRLLEPDSLVLLLEP